jgi:hypothetical protein
VPVETSFPPEARNRDRSQLGEKEYRMKLRIALAGFCAAAIAAVAAPAPALAGPNDNSAAGVTGVASVPPGYFCGAGYFCLWTGSYWSGRQFQLFRCRTYSLTQWNGVGSWLNNQTGGARALIQDANRRTLINAAPNASSYAYNFKPAWFITPC